MQALASHLCLSPPPAPAGASAGTMGRKGWASGWGLRTPERGAVLKDSE